MLKRLFSSIRGVFSRLRCVLAATLAVLLTGCHHAAGMLTPAGPIAHEQRILFFDAIAIMLIVVLPVIILSFAFAHRYRASHRGNGDYRPEWSHNTLLEVFWWGIPLVIVLALGVITWRKSHKLDPYRELSIGGRPMQVEVIALPWKWLFIYPEQHIAAVNTLTIPTNRQVEFLITADAPMSAFFIPRLGSQIYAMAGMRTRLHLIAARPGTYIGLDSQYNGDGFSDMKFKVHAIAAKRFDHWVQKMHTQVLPVLDQSSYTQLMQPSIADKPKMFKLGWNKVFTSVMHRYMNSHRPKPKNTEG